MADIATLGIQVKMDGVAQASKGLDVFGASAESAEKKSGSFTSAVQGASGALDMVKTAALGAAAAFSVNALVQMADTWSDLNSRVSLSIGEFDDTVEVMGRLSDMARRTYSSLEVTTESFIANSTALKELGYTTEQQLNYTEALNNALVVSGARAERAAMIQNALSKAMAAGRLSGQELNTVIESGGRVAEVLAEELGVGTNQLRALGAQGEITGKVINDALVKRMDILAEQAESMPATFGDAFQLMRNSVLQSFGAMDQAGGISESLAGSLVVLANNMDLFVKAATAVAGVGAAKYLSSLVGVTGQYTQAQFAAISAEKQSIASKRESLVAEVALNAERVKSAQMALLTKQNNGLIGASYAQLNRELAVSQMALAKSNASLAATTKTMQGMTLASQLASRAASGLSTALSFIGGPMGLAITAVGATMYYLSTQSVKATADVDRYSEAIKKAGEDSDTSAGAIERAASAMTKVSSSATFAEVSGQVADAVEKQRVAFANLTESFNAAGRGLTGMSFYFSDAREKIGALITRFESGEIAVEDFNKEMDELAKQNPDLTSTIAEIQRLAKNAAAATGFVLGLSSALNNLGNESGKGGRVNALNNSKAVLDAAEEQYRQALDFALRYGEIQDKLGAGKVPKAEKKKKGGKSDLEKESEDYSNLFKSAQQRVQQMQQEAQLVGKNAIEADVLRMKLYLLQQAQEKGLTLSKAQTDQLNGLADAYGAAARKVAELQLMEDARFNRAQLGRSAIEQQIASELRSAGIEMDSVAGQSYAAYAKMTDAISTAKTEAKSFASSFITDLLNGKSALESLTGALQKLGDKLIDMALDEMINGLFKNLLGILGGGGGGGWMGPSFFPPAPGGGGLGLFAKGGISDKPAIFGEAGPEAAVPLPDGRSIPVTLNGGSGGGGEYVDRRQYNFTGTQKEFDEFRKFVIEKDRQFDARAQNAVKKGSKKNVGFN